MNAQLLINKKPYADAPRGGVSGDVIWIYLPKRGRFIFTFTPAKGYKLAKGTVRDNRISWTMNGDSYEWISASQVLPYGGMWNIWVLLDISYNDTRVLCGAGWPHIRMP